MRSLTRLLRDCLIKAYPLFHGCAACTHRPMPLSQRTVQAAEPDFPVDLVYLWVDGDDPQLAQRRRQYLPDGGQDELHARDGAHYRDNEELRFALRSQQAYAHWFRQVIIVTDRQVPAWLDASQPGVRIVDHREFIPAEYLPTFSCRPVEAYLHHIPGLAEHYVYCNDDFFFARPASKLDFFTDNGLPYVFTDWRESRREGYERADSAHAASWHNARRFMREAGDEPPDLIVAHGPYAQTRSNALMAESYFQDALPKFCCNRFRGHEDISFYPHAIPILACLRKRMVPCDIPYLYMNAKRFDRMTCYRAMLRDQSLGAAPLFLCLNDVGHVGPAHTWQRDMVAFLNAYYPLPSVYEKPVEHT